MKGEKQGKKNKKIHNQFCLVELFEIEMAQSNDLNCENANMLS